MGDIGGKRRRIEVLPEQEPKQEPVRIPAPQREPVTTPAPAAR